MTARLDGLPRRDKGNPMPRARRRRQQRTAEVLPRDLRRLRYFGQIADSLKPFASEMARELGDLLADKGDGATAAERTVLEDVARVGLLLRATFAAYLQAPDVELAKTVSTLAGQRRASLAVVGMERRARPITVSDIVETIQAEKAEP